MLFNFLIYSSLRYIYSISLFYFHLIMTFWKSLNIMPCFIIFYRRFLSSNVLLNLLTYSKTLVRHFKQESLNQVKIFILRSCMILQDLKRFWNAWFSDNILLYLPVYKLNSCISRPPFLKAFKHNLKFWVDFPKKLILSSQELIFRRYGLTKYTQSKFQRIAMQDI